MTELFLWLLLLLLRYREWLWVEIWIWSYRLFRYFEWLLGIVVCLSRQGINVGSRWRILLFWHRRILLLYYHWHRRGISPGELSLSLELSWSQILTWTWLRHYICPSLLMNIIWHFLLHLLKPGVGCLLNSLRLLLLEVAWFWPFYRF